MDAPEPTEHGRSQHLWAPWRMAYVGRREATAGCIFCARLAAGDDTASLILLRGRLSFVIMNLFPYNTGHVMIVPRAHVADLGQTDDATLTEMATTLPRLTRASRRALDCHGFNVGLNIGAVAGAGIADHLHQHVVPRWTGDANFMPIVAGTIVMPEVIPVTYAKLRAELHREMQPPPHEPASPLLSIVWSASKLELLLTQRDDGWHLPTIEPEPDQPLWRTALAALDQRQGLLDLTGVSATSLAEPGGQLALTFQARPGYDPREHTMMNVSQALENLPEDELTLVLNGRSPD